MTDTAPDPSASRPVDAIADAYVEQYAALAPTDATYIGVAGHDAEMTDYSPDGFAAREALARRTLNAVEAATASDPREQVARAAMIERLRLGVELYDARQPQSALNVIASPMHDVRLVFDLMPTDAEDDWATIATRLAKVPAALDGYRRTLLDCARGGSVAARRQVLACAEQCASWTDRGEGGDVFDRLVGFEPDGGAVPSPLRRALHRSADSARDAYDAFGRFLRDELAPLARETDAVGPELYRLHSRNFLGATVDLDETYTWGWGELRRIEQDMAETASLIVPAGSVDDAVAALDADPARTIAGKEAFRRWMQQLADRTIDELAGTHFDIPEPVRRIECCLAPTGDGGIYYTGPSEDFSRPGQMWWAVPEGIDDFSTWREVTTVFHEGVPGHHLQVGQTAFRSELLNRWQRLMCWCAGHGEGWALYAERLMDDLGYLDDPGDRLGMLDAQAFRAARVVVDIGMHMQLRIPPDNPFGFHPGERWTPELGVEFLRQHTRMEDAFIRFELDRYLGWPGQAPSYKVGERIWLQARDEARARQGANFDLARFHRAALDLGSLGLDPLRESLARL